MKRAQIIRKNIDMKQKKFTRGQERYEQQKQDGNHKKADRTQANDQKSSSLCPALGKCGGCHLINLPYGEQLKQKQKNTQKLLASFGKLEPIIGMDHPFHYRNKVSAAFSRDRKGNIISGIYEEGTHRVVPVDHCLLENETADRIIVTIRGLLRSFKIKVYDEDSGYGLLRHVLVRTSHATGEIMVVLITASPVFPSKNNFVKVLRDCHPEITTVIQNINGRHTSMVLGEKEHILYGKGYIEDILCGKRFRISPRSFYQVNSVQTEKLYELALEYGGCTGRERVLDAYCGAGTIGILAADRAEKVIGVELNRDAVRDAVFNAKQNGLKNISFYHKDAGEFMCQLAACEEHMDVVFMDPPRAGSDRAFLDALCTLRPDRIVYISCNPETLKRDLEILTRKWYRVERMRGVDMFPGTGHVESIALLSKLKSNKLKHINVKLEMDKLDLTAAESKATYEEIKDYVLK